MDNQRPEKPSTGGTAAFSQAVGTQEKRKLRAKQRKQRSIWLGLGMVGLIGWSVAVPTLLGVTCGVWIDTHFPSRYSWTLMLLLIGVILGCANAWHWVTKEQREIHKEQKNENRHEQR
jgi:ATP synthase protein I